MAIPKEIWQLFDSIRVAVLATSNSDGVPNAVPVACKRIVDENTLWIIDVFFDKTKANIMENDKVSVSFWDGKEGYQIKGKAAYHSDGKTFEAGKEWILSIKPGKVVRGVVEIKVEEIYSTTPGADAGKRIA